LSIRSATDGLNYTIAIHFRWESRTHEKSQVESSEHQDDADIHHQSFPESISEERKIYADYNGCHHHRVEHPNYPSAHFSKTSCADSSPDRVKLTAALS